MLSLEIGDRRKLTSPPKVGMGDLRPRFSPDGKTLAFARTSSGSDTKVYLLPLNATGNAAGEPRLVLNEPDGADFDWTADGRKIVYSSARNGSTSTLWTILASGGMPGQLNITSEKSSLVSL